ncbi:MAG TPA: imidazole glycerol phosphate synthase subunit HisH [Acidobacteriaceae bacterium]
MIAVIDYKAGNLTSVMKALTALGAAAQITEDAAVVRAAERVVLPGVGHFAATARLRETGIEGAVREVIARGVPFLGICVGLQWLFEGSTESEATAGIGAMRGCCARFPEPHKVPHVGWNTLAAAPESRLLAGLPAQPFVYYTHSYRAPVIRETVGVTQYAGPFSGAVERGNLFGVQFHPEKSGDAGLQVLRNFLAVPGC